MNKHLQFVHCGIFIVCMRNDNNIDWNQVRIDASINIMNAILSSSIMVFIFQFIFKRQIADIAVSYADKLIEELKKNK